MVVDSRPIVRDPKFTTSFSGIISNAAPSVANIFTSKTIRPRSREVSPLEGIFGMRPRTFRAQSLGSGVVISKEGFILTNNHVVEGADEISVSIANNTRVYTAKVVGTDPQTDLAVIKIESDDDIPAIILADSDTLAVGDVVLAIGNPFGVGQTVTMGIVGAVGRGGFGIVDYEDFIQTDASINPGNSGGALIDAEGRLVGINTAIISPSGANQGVGFAIPINMARDVMEKIIENGRVVRGYLGIYLEDVTPALARRLDLPQSDGALVVMVARNSPAADADLRSGDLITEFVGKRVVDSRQLRLMASQTAPDTRVPIQIKRNGKSREIEVTLGEMPTRQLGRNEEGDLR